MRLFWLLVVIYVMIGIAITLAYLTRTHRNYWHRVITYVPPCPLGRRRYQITRQAGITREIDGIFSYSLYGNYAKYSPNLLISLDRIKEIRPTWQGWVYAPPDLPPHLESAIIDKGGRVVIMTPEEGKGVLGHEGALWRYLPLGQDKPFLCLDADDVISDDFFRQLDLWLATDLPFCSLNYYTFLLPFTARAWGSRGRQMPEIEEEINQYCEYWFGFDETFLRQSIWPIAKQRGCWLGDAIRFDLWLATFLLILVALIILSLYYAY